MGLVLNCLKTPFALLHQLSQRSLISRYAVVHSPTSGRKVKLPPFTNLAIKRHRTTSYRPITILPTLSKLLERIVHAPSNLQLSTRA
jgi:hypothetical protein